MLLDDRSDRNQLELHLYVVALADNGTFSRTQFQMLASLKRITYFVRLIPQISLQMLVRSTKCCWTLLDEEQAMFL